MMIDIFLLLYLSIINIIINQKHNIFFGRAYNKVILQVSPNKVGVF